MKYIPVIALLTFAVMFGGKALVVWMWNSGSKILKHLAVMCFVAFPVAFYIAIYFMFIK